MLPYGMKTTTFMSTLNIISLLFDSLHHACNWLEVCAPTEPFSHPRHITVTTSLYRSLHSPHHTNNIDATSIVCVETANALDQGPLRIQVTVF